MQFTHWLQASFNNDYDFLALHLCCIINIFQTFCRTIFLILKDSSKI